MPRLEAGVAEPGSGRLLRHIAQVLALAAVYVAVARAGLTLGAVSRFAALVWPATGISLAVLLAGGFRLWPGVALGALAVNVWTGAPLPVAAGIAAGNTLEALAGACMLRWLGGYRDSFHRLSHVLALVGGAALGSTLVSATVGASSLLAGAIISRGEAFVTWRAWWLGNALGDLVVASLLLAWLGPPRAPAPPHSRWEAAALAASLVVASALVFGHSPASEASGFLEAYLLMPLLIWAALRFGMRGGTAAVFAVSAIAIAGTTLGRGPFVQETLSLSLLSLQAFMAITAVTVLVFGAVIAERAEAILRREEFLAIVSHDLRNPLNVIKMASRALLSQLPREAGDRAGAQAVGVIERSMDRVDSLVRDFLDFAAIEAGRLELRRQVHDAAALVLETVEMMRPLAVEKSQRLEPALTRESVAVFCDRERVLQVLSNLVGNALKFTPAGGTVTVRLDRFQDRALFSVADTGPGISADELPHVFERFWKAPQSSRLRTPGVGLGLSIARGIVDAHGGSIRVVSEVGAGSEFYVSLPLPAAAGRGPGPDSAGRWVRVRALRSYLLHLGHSEP